MKSLPERRSRSNEGVSWGKPTVIMQNNQILMKARPVCSESPAEQCRRVCLERSGRAAGRKSLLSWMKISRNYPREETRGKVSSGIGNNTRVVWRPARIEQGFPTLAVL